MSYSVKGVDNLWHVGSTPYVKNADGTWHVGTKLFDKVQRGATATVSNKALTTNVATLTTSVAHGFQPGDYVRVTGVDAVFNGEYVIIATPLTTTFTYAKTNANVGSTAATGNAAAEYWQEVWPLVPSVPTGLALTQVYRSSRIEYDFVWVAPSSGAAVTNYTVKVYINSSLYNTYTITAPTVAMTLTNSSAGFQSYAGQSVYFTVTPNSAGGAGPMATSGTQTAINVPPPAAPAGLASTSSSTDYSGISFGWSTTTDATTYDIEILNAAGASITGAVNVGAALTYRWTGSSQNTQYQVRVRGVNQGVAGPWCTAIHWLVGRPLITHPSTATRPWTTTLGVANWGRDGVRSITVPARVVITSVDMHHNTASFSSQFANSTALPGGRHIWTYRVGSGISGAWYDVASIGAPYGYSGNTIASAWDANIAYDGNPGDELGFQLRGTSWGVDGGGSVTADISPNGSIVYYGTETYDITVVDQTEIFSGAW